MSIDLTALADNDLFDLSSEVHAEVERRAHNALVALLKPHAPEGADGIIMWAEEWENGWFYTLSGALWTLADERLVNIEQEVVDTLEEDASPPLANLSDFAGLGNRQDRGVTDAHTDTWVRQNLRNARLSMDRIE